MTTFEPMHAGERAVSTRQVARLVAQQFPRWADLPLRRVASSGTVNAIFRLGDDLVVRLPRVDWDLEEIEREFAWLPQLAPNLPLDVPVPLAKGAPGAGFPWPWAVYRWLDGVDAAVAPPHDMVQAARDLARFIRALRRVAPQNAPESAARIQLRAREGRVRAALAELDDVVDVTAASEAWEAALRTPPWTAPLVWTHGDLIPPNLLVRRGRIGAVIDFGNAGLADPACDLVPAWSLLPRQAREVFRAELGVDDATWRRGQGWALSQALLILPYYRCTNRTLYAVAQRVVGELCGHGNSTWRCGRSDR